MATTANALSRAQTRFDAAAAAEVQAAENLAAEPTPDAGGPDLVTATADLAQERLLNQVLIGVFRAQDQQQQDLLKIRS